MGALKIDLSASIARYDLKFVSSPDLLVETHQDIVTDSKGLSQLLDRLVSLHRKKSNAKILTAVVSIAH